MLITSLFCLAALSQPQTPLFSGNLESLKQYKCPEWFRDAKLGIWAHWGPQAVPMEGDWYARNMYNEGSRQYKHHLETYGHPSVHGYKDIIPLWKAEKWDPKRLMKMYKEAGAKYFVSMGVHHDNFDLWNSKHNRWNAVNMGPKRNVVQEWKDAAAAQGMKFGVSEHLGASFTWFQMSRLADKKGPLAGVPYDGVQKEFEDLYHFAAKPGDKGWYSNDPRWQAEWFARIKDLVDQVKPDLLYSDGALPFDKTGASLVAHFYNQNARQHGGKVEAIYNCKETSNGKWVQDLERGVMSGILKDPWQTDTSIGDWFYNKSWKFRGADWVIRSLVDIVSKNGNLLINVVQRPDGSLDPEAEKLLGEMKEWMNMNSESIFNTRPWVIFGEGSKKVRGGAFAEDFGLSASDIRYTRKGNTVYATLLGWPGEKEILFKNLGTTGVVKSVRLLGSSSKIGWKQSTDGLKVVTPKVGPSQLAVVFKVETANADAFKPVEVASIQPVVLPDAKGAFALFPEDAECTGTIAPETKGTISNLGFWDNPADSITWQIDLKAAGEFEVIASLAAADGASKIVGSLGAIRLTSIAPKTADWSQYVTVSLGTMKIATTGKQSFTLTSASPSSWKAVNVRSIRFNPVKS